MIGSFTGVNRIKITQISITCSGQRAARRRGPATNLSRALTLSPRPLPAHVPQSPPTSATVQPPLRGSLSLSPRPAHAPQAPPTGAPPRPLLARPSPCSSFRPGHPPRPAHPLPVGGAGLRRARPDVIVVRARRSGVSSPPLAFSGQWHPAGGGSGPSKGRASQPLSPRLAELRYGCGGGGGGGGGVERGCSSWFGCRRQWPVARSRRRGRSSGGQREGRGRARSGGRRGQRG